MSPDCLWLSVMVISLLPSRAGGRPIKGGRQKRQLLLPVSETSAFQDGTLLGNLPLFPFTHHMSQGIEIDDGMGLEIGGELAVPILDWGLWDLNGNMEFGLGPNFYTKVGHLVRPVNPLKISPSTVAALNYQPQVRALRESVGKVPVARLPFGYTPVRCRPPLCNPFVGNVGVGVEVEEADDDGFLGAIDFPVPIAPGGYGVRFPLSGRVQHETSPVGIAYGIGLNPVNPFKDLPPFRRRSRSRTNGRVRL